MHNIFVDYTKPLLEMIRDGNYDYEGSGITEKNFPINRRQNGEVKMKVFSTEELVSRTQPVTSEEVTRAMTEKGYRPAELPEALAYVKANPDEQRRYLILILGSIWQYWIGDRSVPYLWRYDGVRKLSLFWSDNNGWGPSAHFLAVRK